MWPGVSELPDYKTSFPNWKPGNQLNEAVPQLDSTGLDILKVRKLISLSKLSVNKGITRVTTGYPYI